jgi:ribosomal protein S18 acetylase RimI-like enzyme
MLDDMGLGNKGLSVSSEKLVNGILNYPSAFVLFATKRNNKIAGMAVCFEGFSTFLAMPLINIHDLIVYKKYRRQGIARRLLEAVEVEAKKRSCCRITLEVRDDNLRAKPLYTSLGYGEQENHMLFWGKKLL